MVTDLEKTAGDVVGRGKNNVIRDLIEKTRIWLVDQMGKKFPSEKHNGHFLSANPVVGRGGRGKKACSSSLSSSTVDAAAHASSPSPSPLQ
jgi:hypothetical protein